MTDIRLMIEDLLQVIQALQRWELVGARKEILEGVCTPQDIQEGGLKDGNDNKEDENCIPHERGLRFKLVCVGELVKFIV
jgi:hypothetical protein